MDMEQIETWQLHTATSLLAKAILFGQSAARREPGDRIGEMHRADSRRYAEWARERIARAVQ